MEMVLLSQLVCLFGNNIEYITHALERNLTIGIALLNPEFPCFIIFHSALHNHFLS